MKKFMAAALVALMVVQTATMAFAANYGTLGTDLTLEVKSGKGDYAASAEVEAGDTVDFKATIDMSNIEEQFVQAIADAEAFVDGYYEDNANKAKNVKADMRDVTFEDSSFTLVLAYPTGLVLPAEIAKGSAMSGFDDTAKLAFEEVKRTVSVAGAQSTLTIEIKVKDDVTVGEIENSLKTDASYLADMVFVGEDVEVTKTGAYAISGEMTGSIDAEFDFDGIGKVSSEIKFEDAEPAAIDVVATAKKSVVSGTVEGAEEGATAMLVKGSVTVAEANIVDGAFEFDTEVENGIYNIVVVSGGKTVTTMVEINDDTEVGIAIPVEKVNTQIEVDESAEKDVVVNMDDVAEQKKTENETAINEGGSIDIKTIILGVIEEIVEKIEEAVNAEAEKEEDKRQVEALTGVKTEVVVKDSEGNQVGETETVDKVEEGKHVHVVVPFNTSGRKDFSVIRSVAGEGEEVEVETLTQVSSADEAVPGTFYIDEETDMIHIYSADATADFAVAYTNVEEEDVTETIPETDEEEEEGSTPGRNPGRGGSGTGTTITGGTSSTPELIMPFTDVKTSDWYYDSVKYVYDNGIFKGATDTTFEPDTAITRGMIVTVLGRSNGIADAYAESTFVDVAADEYYAAHIKWAAENGIVLGYGDGNYGPNDLVTREQMAAIIYRYMNYLGRGPVGAWAVQLPYADIAEISDYAVEPIMFCYMNGIMTGKNDNVFDPQGSATRAEAATIMMRCEF